MLALLLAVWAAAAHAEAPAGGERQRELLHLLRQDCGSCHGITLRGGLGPPLLPAALAGKDFESLKRVILDGRSGTAMPGWRRFLKEDEAAWLVQLLRQGVPDGY